MIQILPISKKKKKKIEQMQIFYTPNHRILCNFFW